MTGTTLSHYQIVSELGRGGMGIVYRATDTKLNREVAVKVLPATALSNEDDRARFYREAQAAAQLHHPNIATIFEIDEAVPSDAPHGTQPSPFIAMELIDGQSLSERIAEGPVGLEESVRITSEIAAALELAHEKNIVHRDIKSANVMLTKKGVAKVLDFGLAKTAQSTQLTRMGSTLGTVAYMSPEQARGEEVDRRADIWALGVVLYEMASGRHPFAGDYEQAVIYGILNEDPQPLTAIRTGFPMGLEWIISKCLAKKADDRYQRAEDLLVDLRTVDLSTAGGLSRVSTMSGISNPPQVTEVVDKKFGLREALVVCGVLFGLLLGFFLFGGDSDSSAKQPVSFVYDRIPNFSITNLTKRAVAISTDGKWIAVSSSGSLFAGRTDRFDEAHVIVEETGMDPHTPIAEPSGARFAYVEGIASELTLTSALGGVSLNLADAHNGGHTGGTGHSWGGDGYIYGAFNDLGVFRTPIDASQSEQVLPVDGSTDRFFATPLLLPGERFLVYASADGAVGWENASLKAYDLENGTERLLYTGGSDPKFIAPDILVFSKAGQLLGGRIDPNDPQRMSNVVPVVDSDMVWSLQAVAQYDVSSEGHLVYISGDQSDLGWNLAYHSRDGLNNIEPIASERKIYYSPAISPDGNAIAVDYHDSQSSVRVLVIVDLTTGRTTEISTENSVWTPVWSPDGSRIAFAAAGHGNGLGALVWRAADLSDEIETLYAPDYWVGPDSWSPDGSTILVSELAPDSLGGRNLTFLDLETREVTPFLVTEYREEDGRYSPDGDWIAYTSDRTGNPEIWLSSSTPGGFQVKVSDSGGRKARWAPDGQSIVYINEDRLFEVPISFDGQPSAGETTMIVEGHYYFHYNTGAMGEYDIHPDGRLVMFDRDTYDNMTGEIRVVLNWGDQIQSLIPPAD